MMKQRTDNIGYRIEKRFRKALREYRLISDGDHVLVGLSGGMDSLLLVELLGRRMKILKPRFTVSAVHVRMENIGYATDTTQLEAFCREQGVELHTVTTQFDTTQENGHTAAANSHKRKTPCFLCSWNRRKQLFNLAQQLGCNKIALGHHQDDALHTMLMNLVYEGRFEGMPPLLQLDRMPLAIIRPLILEHESDIKAYAAQHHYPKLVKNCPYEELTRRSDVTDLYRKMEQLNPDVRHSLWHALTR